MTLGPKGSRESVHGGWERRGEHFRDVIHGAEKGEEKGRAVGHTYRGKGEKALWWLAPEPVKKKGKKRFAAFRTEGLGSLLSLKRTKGEKTFLRPEPEAQQSGTKAGGGGKGRRTSFFPAEGDQGFA